MGNTNFEIDNLPDIEMYGGDTLPWEVVLVRNDGSKLSVDAASECTATLTLMPLKATTGIGANANTIAHIFQKSGEVRATLDDNSIVMFSFSENDTKGLRGKFLYQIDIKHGDDLRVCQGRLYIKQNINR